MIQPRPSRLVLSHTLEHVHKGRQQEWGNHEEEQVFGIFDRQNYVFLKEQPGIVRPVLGSTRDLDDL